MGDLIGGFEVGWIIRNSEYGRKLFLVREHPLYAISDMVEWNGREIVSSIGKTIGRRVNIGKV